jgi:cephalosporin-C deacetylase-like acetyl esterase
MILNYLGTRGDLDMDHVAIFGQGSGGAIAILAAAADPRIKAVDALNPWGDWPDWLAKTGLIHDNERANFLKPEFLASVAGLDPVAWLPKLKTERLRIQNLMDDPVNPEAAQKAIEAAAPENTEINKFGDGPAMARAMGGGALFDWIKEQVKPGAEVKTVAADQRVHVYPAQGSSIH